MKQKKAIEEETSSILAKIQSDGLEDRLAKANANVEAMKISVEEEKQRKNKLKTTYLATKNRVDEKKKAADEKVSVLLHIILDWFQVSLFPRESCIIKIY